MIFYLGTHRPSWLRQPGPPLMVSRCTMPTKRLPVAETDWVLDSGGFTELAKHGRWTLTAEQYAPIVRRYRDEIGRMEWAAPQDWMCEPSMLAKSGLTVETHQLLTFRNFRTLRDLAPDLPIIPVLQGWTRDDYLRHVDQYAAGGFDLTTEPTVGVGSVCRRQDTTEAAAIFRDLHALGLRLHGFGLKVQGIAQCWPYLSSADSLAWSLDARMTAERQGSCGRLKPNGEPIKSCANCRHYAVEWWAGAHAWPEPVQGVLA